MKGAALFTESTTVPVQKSVSDIVALLVRAGAVAINQDYQKGTVTGLSFVIPHGAGKIPYKLPVRTEAIYQKLKSRRVNYSNNAAEKDREQAERIAWRQLYWWMKSQLAMIQLGMVSPAEVLMPYMLGSDGHSFFETHGPKLLEGPAKAGTQ